MAKLEGFVATVIVPVHTGCENEKPAPKVIPM